MLPAPQHLSTSIRRHPLLPVVRLKSRRHDRRVKSSVSSRENVPAATSYQQQHPIAVSIPGAVTTAIDRATKEWVQAATTQPLIDDRTGAHVHLLGLAHFAPHQHAPVASLIGQLAPTVVALEQPLSTASASTHPQQNSGTHAAAHGSGQGVHGGHAPVPPAPLLPHPPYIELLLDYYDQLQQLPPGNNDNSNGRPNSSSRKGSQSSPPLQPAVAVSFSHLLDQLPTAAIGSSYRLGRDVLDPFEAFGFYPGLDYAQKPEQIASCLRLFGFAPGLEYATAVQAAGRAGAQVHCIEPPLGLQASWVATLLRRFTLQQKDLSRQLGKELQAARALLPASHVAWDADVAAAVGRLQADPLAMTTAFKVCKAAAAAMLGPQQAVQAVQQQAVLQPLKFAHFEARALHMARQLLELCVRQAGGGCAVGVHVTAPLPLNDPSLEAPASAAAASGAKAPVILAVLGRQYVPMIRRLWSDPTSELWRGEVPRSFAPSHIPHTPAAPAAAPGGVAGGSVVDDYDPDVEHGGSRPVGHKPVEIRL